MILGYICRRVEGTVLRTESVNQQARRSEYNALAVRSDQKQSPDPINLRLCLF